MWWISSYCGTFMHLCTHMHTCGDTYYRIVALQLFLHFLHLYIRYIWLFMIGMAFGCWTCRKLNHSNFPVNLVQHCHWLQEKLKVRGPKIANMLFKKTFRFNQKIIRNDSYVLGGHIKNFSTCYKYVKSLRVIEEYIILIDILKFIYIYIELCLNMQILRHFCRCKAKAENNAMASGKRGKERRVSIDHCLLFCKQSPSCKNHKT